MGNAQSAPYESPTMNSEKHAYPIRTTTNNRQPQPYTGSFFNTHMAPATPHQQAKKPNRPAGHINFFEVASVTVQPASVKSIHTNSSSSSIKTSSTNKKSYPSTMSSQQQLKKYTSNVSMASSGNSSVTSTTIATENESKPSVVSDYININGRKYWKAHGSQKFILPCDDDENDRLMTMVKKNKPIIFIEILNYVCVALYLKI